MKKKDIIVGEWYWIDYQPSPNSKRSFVGPAKCVNKESHEHPAFVSPLNEDDSWRRWMLFAAKDVKRPCDPLPTYKELLDCKH